jgi:hypothetical protein
MSALRPLVVVAVVLSAVACSKSGTGKLGVSARTDGPSAAASVDVGGGVAVERVRVLVRKLELDRAATEMSPMEPMDPMPMGMALSPRASHGAGEGGDDGGGDDDEVELGPVVVDVSGAALAGRVTRVFDADVPDGAYRELEIVIAPVSTTAQSGPIADLRGASVVVDGTRTPPGAEAAVPFRFASSLLAKQELETRLLVDHAGASANVTLVLDVTRWFTAADGSPLDPGVAANQAAIEANMLANLRFERDDDEDGVDDEHGER